MSNEFTSLGGMPARTRGFTLLELLISVTVMALLVVIAAPGFSSFLGRTRTTGSATTLAADLNFARTEAIMRNVPVLMCAKDPAASRCGTTQNWQVGWVVCVDADADGSCDAGTAAAPNPMRVRVGATDGLMVTGPAAALRFSGLGSVALSATFSVSGSLAGTPTRAVQVASSGQVRSY
jgi:prepilin-type N-terminal cleavage/methylation domain-containing protein